MKASEMIDVTVVAHPFAVGAERAEAPAGSSLAAIVEGVQPDIYLRRHAHVHVGGHYVPQERWARVYPKSGVPVEIRMVPMGGGGGKNPLRTVLSLAVMMASPGLGSALAGSVGGSAAVFGLGGKIITAGMNLLGKLALNALAPPGRGRFSGARESPTLFIQGARNGEIPFGRVPKVLGTHRMVPPLGAPAYTETVGNDQYLRMLFVWGYGPLEISDLKIGETPLSDFDGVEIETREGHDDDAPVTLYSNSVQQNDLQVNATFAAGYIVRAAETEADEVSVDITFPRGLFALSAAGARVAATVQVSVGWSPRGENDWTDQTFTWTAAQGAALRKDVRFSVPRGEYDVRVKRLTADAVTDDVFNECAWTALRTVRFSEPVRMPGIAMTALRIKATDQLNGVIDRFNGIVRAVIPDWNGTAWVSRATSNPAALFRHVLQGGANARPLDDARIDLARIEEWHGNCALAGREFNAVIDHDVSVREVLHDIAAAGRASPGLIDGKWAVTEDRLQSVPVQHFTPRNTWGFSGEKAFDDLPHALRVRFINRDKGWLQDEVLVFDDGYDEETAVKYETLALTGVTSAAQAWKDGRYHIATARLRPEQYSFYADVEHIVCTKGDLVRFTHDVPLFGLASARAKAVAMDGGNAVGVTLDEKMLMEAGKTYALRFRKATGATLVVPLVTAAGAWDAVSFAFAVPEAQAPAAGDLAMFGESGQESVELVVKSIEPGRDLSARITCVDAAPGVHAAGEGAIPAFSPQISVPPEMQRPPAPVIAGVRAGADYIDITLAPVRFALPLYPDVRIRQTDETDFHAARFAASGGQVVISDVSASAVYDIRIIYRNIYGVSSPPALVANYRMAETPGVPGNVQNFALSSVGDTAFLSWDAVPSKELSGYRVKFNDMGTGAHWANSAEACAVLPRTATSIALPARAGAWLIKALTADGHESAAASIVSTALDRREGYALCVAAEESAHFSGAMSSGAGTSSGVVFTDDDRLVLDDGEAAGVYYFEEEPDLGGVYACLLSPEVEIVGVSADDDMDAWENTDALDDWDCAADPSTWGARIEVQSTEDDPSGSPEWSAWRAFAVGECRARAFRFRMMLSSQVAGVTPSVSALKINLSMKRWAQGDFAVTSNSGDNVDGFGTRVDHAEEFYDHGAIAVTPSDMATGDYYVIDGRDETGFYIRFYNASAARITRTFDYIAHGIGRKASS